MSRHLVRQLPHVKLSEAGYAILWPGFFAAHAFTVDLRIEFRIQAEAAGGHAMPAELNATSTLGLLERIRAGDESAFSALFRKYSPRLSILIHYKLGPEMRHRVEVDDILQETFLAASRQLDKFAYRDPGSFMRWISRIADHVTVDAARYHARQKRRPAQLEQLRTESNPHGVQAVNSVTPSRIFARKERLRKVFERLDELPEDYRQVILLAKIEGLATEEIAARLQKSRENVAVLLHRAIQRLRGLEEEAEKK